MNLVTDQAGTREITYGALDLVTKEEFTDGTFDNLKLEQQFDSVGRRGELKYSITSTELAKYGYGYDSLSWLDRVWRGRYMGAYGYESKGGRVASHVLRDLSSAPSSPPAATAGTAFASATREYDGLGRQKDLYWRSGDASSMTYIEKYDYTYNAANQRTSLGVSGRTDRPDALLEFTYDGYGQLTGSTKTWNAASPTQGVLGQQFGYAYDAIGNRTSATRSELGAGLRTRHGRTRRTG